MIVLRADNLKKSFADTVLFDEVCFALAEKRRYGLVGVNGCGKTTLVRILTGEQRADSGQIALAKGFTLGYLAQNAAFDPLRTLWEETLSVFDEVRADEAALLSLEQEMHSATAQALPALVARQAMLHERFLAQGGLTYQTRTRATLLGMGFEPSDFELPMGALSGGQKSKAQMCKLLLRNCDLLLLDEPTNHLDIASVEWLENYLINYAGSALIISHDRYFLDRVTQDTLELENGHLQSYQGGYSAYLTHKARVREIEQKHYDVAQKEIARMEEMIARFRRWNKERSIRTAEHKEKQLDKLKASTKRPEQAPLALRFELNAKQAGGQDVLIARGLSKAFDAPLFDNVDLHVRKGERVFLLGPNGCGKTTLMRLLTGEMLPDHGSVRLGAQVQVGYYDQQQSQLNPELTPLAEIQNAFPAMNDTQIRGALAAFLFRADDVFKPIHTLSGGERARVELLKLMLGQYNLLLLDEPTNHLDASSCQALEEALLDYEGTIFAISHDRYLVNRLATRVLSLRPEGMFESIGNYDDYLAHLAATVQEKPAATQAEKAPTVSKQWRESAATLRRLRAQLRNTEGDIARLEGEIAQLETQLQQPDIASDYEQTLALSAQVLAAHEQLDAALERWEAQSLALEGSEG